MSLLISHRFALFSAACLTLLCACHLSIDLDDHPYPHSAEEPDANLDLDAEFDTDTAPDAPATTGPQLLISELMIRPAFAPGSTEELGEYIEIFNVGDRSVDPKDLVIEFLETNERISVDRLISSPEEKDVVMGLRPINPGDYFLFLRQDHPLYSLTDHLRPGSFYEYGRWHHSISLPNFTRTLRLIEIRDEFEFVVHHEVGWRQGHLIDLTEVSPTRLDIRENIAFGLRSHITNPDHAADPANWCYHLQRFSTGPLLGSPGGPAPDSCL